METYLARQPIFDRRLKLFAYELLYRSSSANIYTALNGDQASSELISDSLLLFGLENLTRGHKAFINFTAKLLEAGVTSLLPRDRVIIEVLENVEPNEVLLNVCKKIKDEGYLLALDDFAYAERFRPLLDLADIIKVDFLNTRGERRKEIIKLVNRPNIKYLAEKVEKREDLEEAISLGYSYFQGFFFSKPVIVSGRDIPVFKLNYLRILQEINRPDIDFPRIESLIKSDLSLSYKLLKFINSAAFHFEIEIHNIKQALTLLGQREISKWFSLLALKKIGEDKPEELIITAVSRARFCELIAPHIGLKNRSQDLFLMGLFSLLDAFLDQPLAQILQELPLAKDLKRALLGEQSLFGDVYKLVLAYERGIFDEAFSCALKLNLKEKEIIKCYLEALAFANKAFL